MLNVSSSQILLKYCSFQILPRGRIQGRYVYRAAGFAVWFQRSPRDGYQDGHADLSRVRGIQDHRQAGSLSEDDSRRSGRADPVGARATRRNQVTVYAIP